MSDFIHLSLDPWVSQYLGLSLWHRSVVAVEVQILLYLQCRPTEIRTADTLLIFHRRRKTHLFRRDLCP